MNSAISTTVGSAMPRQARMMWKPSVVAICARAGTTVPVIRAAASQHRGVAGHHRPPASGSVRRSPSRPAIVRPLNP